jgi:hypothetical protein
LCRVRRRLGSRVGRYRWPWSRCWLRIGLDSGQPDASALYGVQLGPLMDQRGTAGELVPLLEQVAAELTELTEGITSARANIYAVVGRLENAHPSIPHDRWRHELCTAK